MIKLNPDETVFFSIQGEGLQIGKPVVFVRMAGCNKQPPCSFCDTRYSLTTAGAIEMTPEQLFREIRQHDCKSVVLTGGEPLLYLYKGLEELVVMLLASTYNVQVETNGILFPEPLKKDLVFWSVSPKLRSAGEGSERTWNAISDYLEFCKGRFQIKVVISHKEDFQELFTEKLSQYEVIKKAKVPIVLQPEGQYELIEYRQKCEELVEMVKDNWTLVKDYNLRVLLQVHRFIWGVKRRV